MIFPCHSKCTDCELHATAKHVGIPTLQADLESLAKVKHTALLIVGMAPGFDEDKEGVSWVGWSGDLLRKFITGAKLGDYADIYLANSLRCKIPKDQKSTQKQISSCRKYLLMDIDKLQRSYKEVVILACGADATKAVAGISTISEGLRMQGHRDPVKVLDMLEKQPVLFFTYHPGNLAKNRSPQKVYAVQNHFILLQRYLSGADSLDTLSVIPEICPEPPAGPEFPRRMITDIESYGILKGKEQTVFTPIKSKHVDRIPFGQQVVTVSIGYRDPAGVIRTPVFIFNNRSHRAAYNRWIRSLIKKKGTLCGQNIKFDLLYLRENDWLLKKLLTPNNLKVDDTIIKTFLLDESQPERSLKDLACLFGVANYAGMKVMGKHGNAKSSSDPDLLYYNAYDSAADLRLDEDLDRRIAARYGIDSSKLSDACIEMRNKIIWNTVYMEGAGCAVGIKQLTAVDTHYKKSCEKPVKFADRRGIIFKGKGSQKSLNDFFYDTVIKYNLLNDTRLELTKSKKDISTGKLNRELLLQTLPESDERKTVEQFNVFKEFAHLRNTYSNKLLTNKREGIIYSRGLRGYIFPEWYPVPTIFNKGSRGNVAVKDREKTGGTKQGRITSRKPPSQTLPPAVKDCLMSRFPAGSLLSYDLNRIELVVAGLLSGDPPLREDCENGNPHMETAIGIWPEIDREADDWKSSGRYALGKELNFLVIFRGGPYAYIRSARKNMGLDLTFDFCNEAIQSWYKRHYVHKEWQDEIIRGVMEKGYIILPTGWSRTFCKGKGAAEFTNEICNFPIQTTAAQIMMSIQFEIQQQLVKIKSRAVICKNDYDAITIDCPWEEIDEVDEIADKALTNPPLMKVCEDELGRTATIGYERKVT